MIAESLQPEVNVSELARRWGINRGLLQTWRREAMRDAGGDTMPFMPLRIAEQSPSLMDDAVPNPRGSWGRSPSRQSATMRSTCICGP